MIQYVYPRSWASLILCPDSTLSLLPFYFTGQLGETVLFTRELSHDWFGVRFRDRVRFKGNVTMSFNITS